MIQSKNSMIALSVMVALFVLFVLVDKIPVEHHSPLKTILKSGPDFKRSGLPFDTVIPDEILKNGRLSNQGSQQQYKWDTSLSTSTTTDMTSWSSTTTAYSDSNDIKGNTSVDRISSLVSLHKERVMNITAACRDTTLFKNVSYKIRHHQAYLYSSEYDFAFCKVPKVGSTFWIQLFTVLESGISAGEQMFNYKRSSVHAKKVPFSASTSYIVNNSIKTILTSRDPYSRLFSAYVDKIYLPLYFRTYGTILSTIGRSDKQECELSFQDFLDYVINQVKDGQSLDRHWAPITAICPPCDVNAMMLVKQETFSRDVEYALEAVDVGPEAKNYLTSALHNRRVELTIPGIVSTVFVFGKIPRVQTCLNLVKLARRLWRAFQIQGYIRESIRFPKGMFSNEKQYREPTYLSEVILNTIAQHPLTSTESKTQRRKFLVEAWADIRSDTISDLQKIYKQDFQIYDYDTHPPV